MSLFVQPLASGNAIRLVIAPPTGAVAWRVLRKPGAGQAFHGPADENARSLVDGSDSQALYDIWELTNGSPVSYAVYYLDCNGAWLATVDSQSATPALTNAGDIIDPQSIVRRRLEDGLAAEIARKRLPAPPSGSIQVTTAPFVLADKIAFPNVSVHLDSGSLGTRAIGEISGIGQGIGDEVGTIAPTRLAVIATSQSQLERVSLRLAMTRVFLANIEVFAGLGLTEIDLSWSEMEDLSEQAAPLFVTAFSFSCSSPLALTEPPGVEARLGTVTATN